jgi:hypothetical protein
MAQTSGPPIEAKCGEDGCRRYQAIKWPGFGWSHYCSHPGNETRGNLRPLMGDEPCRIPDWCPFVRWPRLRESEAGPQGLTPETAEHAPPSLAAK